MLYLFQESPTQYCSFPTASIMYIICGTYREIRNIEHIWKDINGWYCLPWWICDLSNCQIQCFTCGKNTTWIFPKVVYFHIGGIINLPTKTRNKQHIAWKAKQAYLCGFNVSAGTPGQIAINMIWAGLWPPIWCQRPLGPLTPNSWGFTLEQERP